ncbi:MAG: hypothetical protein CMN05_06600 [Roseibacillus sp.]|nr:hypothetical protein [Roseibacillus sp.]MBP36842.1 hypothetical protein [Roseibacillus sp.]
MIFAPFWQRLLPESAQKPVLPCCMEDSPERRSTQNLILAGLSLVLSGAALALPDPIRPLWPALVALGLVFATRQAPLSLATACLSALILLSFKDWSSFSGWFGWSGGLGRTLSSPWHFCAILFTLLLGALATVIESSGGLLRLLHASEEITDRTRQRFLSSVLGLGLLCFFDGLANSLMLGRVARPVADRLRIPRAYLSYLVDTTSSAVACLAFLSTWIVTQLGYIAHHSPLQEPAYLQFLSSIPHNFYCLFGLFLAFLSVRNRWLIGPMRACKPIHQEASPAPRTPEKHGTLSSCLIPILVLISTLPLAIILLHRPEADVPLTERIQQSLNASTVPLAFVIASSLALLTAFILFPPRRRQELPRVALAGALQLVPALGILLLAWILGSLFESLETAHVLSRALGSWLPLSALPAGVFVAGCGVSFISGTSWGTMGLLMPLVLPLSGTMAAEQGIAPEVLATIVPAVIGAVFGGAVFGDHCSPYSDTTIISALATGVSTHEHTITQLPYALITAGAALGLGYFPVALGIPGWLAVLSGSGILTALVILWVRRSRVS